jgi:hypothetical protein
VNYIAIAYGFFIDADYPPLSLSKKTGTFFWK